MLELSGFTSRLDIGAVESVVLCGSAATNSVVVVNQKQVSNMDAAYLCRL